MKHIYCDCARGSGVKFSLQRFFSLPVGAACACVCVKNEATSTGQQENNNIFEPEWCSHRSWDQAGFKLCDSWKHWQTVASLTDKLKQWFSRILCHVISIFVISFSPPIGFKITSVFFHFDSIWKKNFPILRWCKRNSLV